MEFVTSDRDQAWKKESEKGAFRTSLRSIIRHSCLRLRHPFRLFQSVEKLRGVDLSHALLPWLAPEATNRSRHRYRLSVRIEVGEPLTPERGIVRQAANARLRSAGCQAAMVSDANSACRDLDDIQQCCIFEITEVMMPMRDAKTVVRRFNEEVIAGGDRTAFEALMAPGFVNRSAPPGTPSGSESMWSTFQDVLRPALAGLAVTIHDQIAEGDKVTTRKTISGRHEGKLFGVEPTGKLISIDVIDIVRVEHGRYVEHWGINNLPTILAGLQRN